VNITEVINFYMLLLFAYGQNDRKISK